MSPPLRHCNSCLWSFCSENVIEEYSLLGSRASPSFSDPQTQVNSAISDIRIYFKKSVCCAYLGQNKTNPNINLQRNEPGRVTKEYEFSC